jgi:hypothetical protein
MVPESRQVEHMRISLCDLVYHGRYRTSFRPGNGERESRIRGSHVGRLVATCMLPCLAFILRSGVQ